MNTTSSNKKSLLFFIVLAQFACTSVWFAGNAVIKDIVKQFHLRADALGHLVSAVQLGFIAGTLVFAIFTISDRFSPSKVFFVCALAGALSNLGIFMADGLPFIILSRFVTGFFLAGIYPVGMKIASDYHKEGLGKAMGYLVGALVLGTAFPHLVNGLTGSLSWKVVMLITSALSVFGGCVIFFFVPDGPNRNKSSKPDFTIFAKVFRNKNFRAAAFGYFGHMWELYAFWAFIPVAFATYTNIHPGTTFNVSFFAFLVIASGGIGCLTGGIFSQYFGSGKVAFTALAISFSCCLLSPFFFQLPFAGFLFLFLIWGVAGAGDSPQFSTLVANSAPVESKGTALTISTSIGFLITVTSIEILNVLRTVIPEKNIYLVLCIGPLLGLIGMRSLVLKKS